jgi:hypothetical protein
MLSGHDPMGGYRFSLGTNAKSCPEIMRKRKDESMIRFNLIGS